MHCVSMTPGSWSGCKQALLFRTPSTPSTYTTWAAEGLSFCCKTDVKAHRYLDELLLSVLGLHCWIGTIVITS